LQILVILVCDGHRFLCTLGNINHLSLLNYWVWKSGCWSTCFLKLIGPTSSGASKQRKYALLARSPHWQVHLLAKFSTKYALPSHWDIKVVHAYLCLPTCDSITMFKKYSIDGSIREGYQARGTSWDVI
jgi:hypothetical protein